MTPVALMSCASYETHRVSTALAEGLELLGGLRAYIKRGDRVLLKPNLLTGQPPENAATTHPAVVDAILEQLVELGARPCLGDSPAFGWVSKVAEACGVAAVARKYGAPIVEFATPFSITSACPQVRKRFTVERTLLDVDAVINLPKLKSHRQLGFTGATKNLYGCMPGKRKAYFHMERGNRDADFARLVAAFAYSLPVTLHVMDAIVTMQRDGPQSGDPRPLGALVLSTDAAAVDAVAAELIRAPVADQLLLNACRELGLGSPGMDRIELRGAALRDISVADFIHPLLVGVRFSPGRLARSVWRNYLITRKGCGPG